MMRECFPITQASQPESDKANVREQAERKEEAAINRRGRIYGSALGCDTIF